LNKISLFVSPFVFHPSVLIMYIEQLFPNLNKVVFLDDDVVIQRDLSPLWEIDLGGKVNGAVETCKGEDEWVMSKHFRNYFNFSHPLIAKHLDPDECAWAYGMNIFDLRAWRKTNIRETYHSWLKEVNPSIQFYWQTLYICSLLIVFHKDNCN
jgi:lipopolysaccharide biosynthesis glycosyltransferase